MRSHASRMTILRAAALVAVLGCGADEPPPARTSETTITVVYDDGTHESMRLSALETASESRDDIKGVLATDRSTRETVVISLDEARAQHPATGKYVVLQQAAPRQVAE